MFPRFEKAEQMNGSGSDGAPGPWIVRALCEHANNNA